MTYGAGQGGAGNPAAYGIEYTNSQTGTPVIVGTCTASSTANEAPGCYASAANMQVGNCVAAGNVGCYEVATGSGWITVTGNLIWSTTYSAISGRMYWTPALASNYIQLPNTSSPTYIYASAGLASNSGGTQITAANTAANVSSSAYFVKKDTGVLTQGSAAAGGSTGPKWGF
jgi:hypothetical protein